MIHSLKLTALNLKLFSYLCRKFLLMITIETIEDRLQKIGKKSFVCHLYPELKKI